MEHGPECACCNGGMSMEKYHEWEEHQMSKHGWYAHFIIDSDEANNHTHGFEESFDHLDIQIALNVPPEVIHSVFSEIADQVRDGRKFEAGVEYDRVIKKYKVVFAKAREGYRGVLRLILPDKDGNLKESEMDPAYAAQWQGLWPAELSCEMN